MSRYPAAGEDVWNFGMTADPVTDSVYVGDCVSHYTPGRSRCRILRYSSTGIVTSYVGNRYASPSSGDGGPAAQAVVNGLSDMTTDAGGALYFTDNNAIRRVDPVTHIVTRFAGRYAQCGSPYAAAGAAAMDFNIDAETVATDPITGNVVIPDRCSSKFLFVNANGVIQSTMAIPAQLSGRLAFDAAGNLFWGGSYKLYRLTRGGTLTVIGGNGTYGNSGDGGPATSAQFRDPSGLAVDNSGNVYLADVLSDVVRVIGTDGVIRKVAGTWGSVGDGGPAGSADVAGARDVAFDRSGNLYVSATNQRRVRMILAPSNGAAISATSTITTFAGGYGAAIGGEVNGGWNPSERCADNCDDDVSTASGEYTETVSDLELAGRGIPLSFSRTYGAFSAQSSGRLGFGWTDNYNMSLSVDSDSNNVAIRQENGSQLTFYPDGNGSFAGPSRQLATLVANADGSYTLTRMARTKFTFSGAGRLVSQRDLNGYTTTLSYDASGRLATVTEPAGRFIQLGYDSADRLATATDSAGRQVVYGYAAAGDLTSVTDVRGKQWSYAYDSAHRLLSRTDPNGHADVANTYDSVSRLATQADGLNRTMTFAYGPGVTTTTSPSGRVTKDYYANGALWKQTKGYGTSVATSTKYGYDGTTLGVTLTTDGNGHTWGATFDAAGNELTATDPLGHQTVKTYDSLNDLKSIKDPKGTTTNFTYDAAGNLTAKQTPIPGTSQTQGWAYGYGDAAHPGDQTSEQDPRGKITTKTYTSYGDLASVTDPEGNNTTFAYDAVGRRTQVVTPKGNVVGGVASDYMTTSTYDAAGNALSQTDPLGHMTSTAFDDAGNVSSATDANGRTTTYVYDAADEQTEIHRPGGSVLKSSFGPDGDLASQTDGANNARSYAYDAVGRLKSALDPLSRMTSYGYDDAGNQVTLTDALNRTTTNVYDAGNRLTSVAYSDGVTPGVTYGYDADDQRTSMTDGSGTSSWTWDPLHRVTQYVNGHGDTLSFGFDLADRRTRVTYPGSKDVMYAYDDAGRMTGLTDWLSHTTSFAYDRNSNLTSTTFPSGTTNVDTYGFDRADRQTSTAFAKGSITLASLDYTRDAKGLLTHVDSTGLPGPNSHDYSYTPLDQLAADNTDTYAYDAADNPTTLAGVAGATFDAANQLTSNASGAYSYSALGERTSSTPTGGSATTYGYDQAGHLTSFTPPTGASATYAYDGTGLRFRKIVGSTTTHFLWDTTASLPLMLYDGSTAYVYGPDGTVVEQIASAGSARYYHHDQLGSTRALTDGAGTVTATATYSPFGQPAGATGSQAACFGFAGQYSDAESGLIYLRARSYDPQAAVFLSVDPLADATRQPYAYADGDPLNGTDPTGLRRRRQHQDPGFWADAQLFPASEGDNLKGLIAGGISHSGPTHKHKVGKLNWVLYQDGRRIAGSSLNVGRGGMTVGLPSGIRARGGCNYDLHVEVVYRGRRRAYDEAHVYVPSKDPQKKPNPNPQPIIGVNPIGIVA